LWEQKIIGLSFLSLEKGGADLRRLSRKGGKAGAEPGKKKERQNDLVKKAVFSLTKGITRAGNAA